ncbi:MAG: class I SAM-dependent methyltransferase [Bryobacteraceae bacterium]
MKSEYLKKNPPSFHRSSGGEPIASWRIDDHTIDLLDGSLRPGMRTVETGAGLSTVLFALHGADHRCIVPDAALVERIQAFCREHRIPTEQITFDIVPSQDVVPVLERNTYDLALIDGCHNFPIAFVDLFYASQALKVGGLLIVDDLHIWTCEVIAKFLRESPSWGICEFTQRVCAAVKEDEADTLAEWSSQPFVLSRSLANSNYSPKIHAFRMALKALREWLPA